MLAGERLAHERRRLQAFSRKMLTSLQRAFSAAKVPTLASSCSFDSTKEEGVPRLRDPFVVSDRVALTQLCSWRNAKGLQRFAACAFAVCTCLQRSQTLPQVASLFLRFVSGVRGRTGTGRGLTCGRSGSDYARFESTASTLPGKQPAALYPRTMALYGCFERIHEIKGHSMDTADIAAEFDFTAQMIADVGRA